MDLLWPFQVDYLCFDDSFNFSNISELTCKTCSRIFGSVKFRFEVLYVRARLAVCFFFFFFFYGSRTFFFCLLAFFLDKA